MDYNFDATVDRTNTNSMKYDHLRRGRPAGVIPLWAGDMDFMTAAPVIRALQKRCRHGIFGYSEIDDSYVRAVRHWYKKRYGWKTERDWLVVTPGVVFSICAAIRAFTAPGDPVIIQQPVYHPFMSSVTGSGRELITSQLIREDGKYVIDYWDFESRIIRNNVKLFLLCSPHNPVGRVWTRQELLRMGDICKRHGVTVISDEIHSDFTYSGHQHTVFADIGASLADITVTLTAPTKTFNIPGLQISNAFIQNDDLRTQFIREIQKTGIAGASLMGIAACRAAYERGAEWLNQLLPYLYGNITYLRDFIAENLPAVQLTEPEGTYLAWLDFRSLGMTDQQLDSFLLEKAGIWLDPGSMFGVGGGGFQRLNFACPRSILEKSMLQLHDAFTT